MALLWEKIDSEFINSRHFHDYETVDEVLLYRAKVPGGWFMVRGLPSQATVINFYPDAGHVWDGSSLPPVPGVWGGSAEARRTPRTNRLSRPE